MIDWFIGAEILVLSGLDSYVIGSHSDNAVTMVAVGLPYVSGMHQYSDGDIAIDQAS